MQQMSGLAEIAGNPELAESPKQSRLPELAESPVLVLGASGYVGARLVRRLLDAGYHVRAAGRKVANLQKRSWANHPSVTLVAVDVRDTESLIKACQGCSAVYYLIHSMEAGTKDFSDTDRRAATNMVEAAAVTGVRRIVYLGGLVADRLSAHLKSRAEVGEILRTGTVPVTELRAAMIIGSGSASFEILRYLVERLPIMITPKWVSTYSQPIAIRDVLDLLIECLRRPETAGHVYDIGGPDILTYRDLMRIYAQEAGLTGRYTIPVPVLTPRLSSYWIHLVTPVSASLARPLAEGLSSETICRPAHMLLTSPDSRRTCREAVRAALQAPEDVSDAAICEERAQEGDARWAGGTRYVDARRIILDVPAARAWEAIAAIGGSGGWLAHNWLWSLRGILDRLVGGPGLHRSDKNLGQCNVNDKFDFWRVVEFSPPHYAKLVAEMKLPGIAGLVFRVQELSSSSTEVQMIATFVPRGLGGIAYWYSVLPFHHIVFRGMLRALARRAGARSISGPLRFNPEASTGIIS